MSFSCLQLVSNDGSGLLPGGSVLGLCSWVCLPGAQERERLSSGLTAGPSPAVRKRTSETERTALK